MPETRSTRKSTKRPRNGQSLTLSRAKKRILELEEIVKEFENQCFDDQIAEMEGDHLQEMEGLKKQFQETLNTDLLILEIIKQT